MTASPLQMMESKVDQVDASEVLKRKADAISLDAFTRKADVDAMISDAVKSLQRQMQQKIKALPVSQIMGWYSICSMCRVPYENQLLPM